MTMADDSVNDQYDEDEHQSPDDALEPADDMFHPASDEEVLDEDNAPPAAPPDLPNKFPIDDPRYDSDLEPTNVYLAGLDDAADDDDFEIDESGMMHELEPEDEDE
jgi:hypothetical protein